MARGRKADPQRAKRGTGHRPAAGSQIVEYVPSTYDVKLAESLTRDLPAGLARQTFKRSIEAMGDRVQDHDLEALQMMAWARHRARKAQQDVEKRGMTIETEWGEKLNPMMKVARDETSLYLKIAEKYGLTFDARLRAGIMQLAGQSMLQQMHNSMAEAIVARIVSK